MNKEAKYFRKPRKYFRKSRGSSLRDRFNPRKLALDILSRFLVKTYRESGQILIKGKTTEEEKPWNTSGKTYLKEAIVRLLGKYYRKEFMEQTISYIKGLTYVWRTEEAKDPMELDREEKIDLERFL